MRASEFQWKSRLGKSMTPGLSGGLAATRDRFSREGFSLIELLVCAAIIAILMAVLLPTLGKARDTAKRIACLNNHKQIGVMVNCYLGDSDGWWPYFKNCYDCGAGNPNQYWHRGMIELGYARESSRLSATSAWKRREMNYFCPALKPVSHIYATLLNRPAGDYALNGLVGYSGGGMGGAKLQGPWSTPLLNDFVGVRTTQIPNPSWTRAIGDREDRVRGDGSQTQRFTYDWAKFGQTPTNSSTTITLYNHAGGSNYLFVDGHAVWTPWKAINLTMFMLRPEMNPGATNYTGWP